MSSFETSAPRRRLSVGINEGSATDTELDTSQIDRGTNPEPPPGEGVHPHCDEGQVSRSFDKGDKEPRADSGLKDAVAPVWSLVLPTPDAGIRRERVEAWGLFGSFSETLGTPGSDEGCAVRVVLHRLDVPVALRIECRSPPGQNGTKPDVTIYRDGWHEKPRGNAFLAGYPQDLLIRLTHAFLQSGAIPVRAIDPRVRDPISQLIVEAIMVRGPCSISQIATYLRDVKGSSSRMTVRSRLELLGREGVVTRVPDSKCWLLTESFVRKTWQFFGTSLNAFSE